MLQGAVSVGEIGAALKMGEVFGLPGLAITDLSAVQSAPDTAPTRRLSPA